MLLHLHTPAGGHPVTAAVALLLVQSLLGAGFAVVAALETEPSPYRGDSVDDVVVWVNVARPEDSRVIATLKASNQTPVKPTGVLVYDLRGKQIQFLPGGTPNNIDIRDGFEYDGRQIPLIAVSNWWSNDVYFYTIDASHLGLIRIFEPAPTGLSGLRGLCLYQNARGEMHYFVLDTAGNGEQHLLDSSGITRLINRFRLGTAAEGCVTDDGRDRLYVAEEKVAIWRFAADDLARQPVAVSRARVFGPLRAEIEGLTIYRQENDEGYLIASSQGASRFVLYDLEDNSYVDSFEITSGTTDRVTLTDGVRAVSASLGTRFPRGSSSPMTTRIWTVAHSATRISR